MRALIFSFLLLLPAVKLTAETLHDVIVSEAYRQVEQDTFVAKSRRQGKGTNEAWLRGIQPGTNFAMLFEKNQGARLLTRWLDAPHTPFKVVEDLALRRQDVAFAQMELRGKLGEQLTLSVYAPHPSYYPMVQLKVVREYSEMEPPLLPVVHQEEVDVNGYKGHMYYTKSSGCSLLLKLERYSIVRIKTNDCRNAALLPQLARELDIKRFNSKITR